MMKILIFCVGFLFLQLQKQSLPSAIVRDDSLSQSPLFSSPSPLPLSILLVRLCCKLVGAPPRHSNPLQLVPLVRSSSTSRLAWCGTKIHHSNKGPREIGGQFKSRRGNLRISRLRGFLKPRHTGVGFGVEGAFLT